MVKELLNGCVCIHTHLLVVEPGICAIESSCYGFKESSNRMILFLFQICFIFEAILLAARIDVYGIVYAVILGLMLITPRTLLPPVWVLYLLFHGLSLMLQYASLVGLPPSLICQVDGED